MNRSVGRVMAGLGVILAAATFAPVASASINRVPGADAERHSGGVDGEPRDGPQVRSELGDAPKDLTVTLPAGLLANASINGGASPDDDQHHAGARLPRGDAASGHRSGVGTAVGKRTSTRSTSWRRPKPGDLGLGLRCS